MEDTIKKVSKSDLSLDLLPNFNQVQSFGSLQRLEDDLIESSKDQDFSKNDAKSPYTWKEIHKMLLDLDLAEGSIPFTQFSGDGIISLEKESMQVGSKKYQEKFEEQQLFSFIQKNEVMQPECELTSNNNLTDNLDRLMAFSSDKRLETQDRKDDAIFHDPLKDVANPDFTAKSFQWQQKPPDCIQKQDESNCTRATTEVIEASTENSELNLTCVRRHKNHHKTMKNTRSKDVELRSCQKRHQVKEKELLQQQEFLMRFESQVKRQEEEWQLLRKNLEIEHKHRTEELRAREDNMKRRMQYLKKKEDEIREEFSKLHNERNLVESKSKHLKQVEKTMKAMEERLCEEQQNHFKKVVQHEEEYQALCENVESIKSNLEKKVVAIKRKAQKILVVKKELKSWQREAEAALDAQLAIFLREKQDLQSQQKMLEDCKYDIEREGARMVNHLLYLDQASAKLELLRRRLDSSQKKLGFLTGKLSERYKSLQEQEKSSILKEEELRVAHNDLIAKVADLNDKEKKLRSKEEALKQEEQALSELEHSLKAEKESLQKRSLDIEKRSLYLEEKACNQSQALAHAEKSLAVEKSTFQKLIEERETSLAWKDSLLEEKRNNLTRKEKEVEALVETFHDREEALNREKDSLFKLEQKLMEELKVVESMKRKHINIESDRKKLQEERELLEKAKESFKLNQAEYQKRMLESRTPIKHHVMEEGEEENGSAKKEAAKTIVTGQLNATKSTLADVSLTELQTTRQALVACFFRRQRESLEEDRGQQQRIEQALAIREAKLWQGEKDLDNMKWVLEEERRFSIGEHMRQQSPTQMLINETERIRSEERTAAIKALHDMPLLEQNEPIIPDMDGNKSNWNLDWDDLSLWREKEGTDACKEGFPTCDSAEFRHSLRHTEGNSAFQSELEKVPSQRRLENVMSSLFNARQASRNRLQRTENLLRTLPLTMGPVASIRNALNSLSSRLVSMERMEEELGGQLEEAYGRDLPASEVMLADKVELLCKMEEQQTLRARWEEDMQQQLKRISMLQANLGGSSPFDTPMKGIRLGSPPASSIHDSSEVSEEASGGINDCHVTAHSLHHEWGGGDNYEPVAVGSYRRVSVGGHFAPEDFHPNSTRDESDSEHQSPRDNFTLRELDLDRNARRRLLMSLQ